VGRWNAGVAKAANVAIAKIVNKQDDNVGLFRLHVRRQQEHRSEDEPTAVPMHPAKAPFHWLHWAPERPERTRDTSQKNPDALHNPGRTPTQQQSDIQ
jgi:hypothetical protein